MSNIWGAFTREVGAMAFGFGIKLVTQVPNLPFEKLKGIAVTTLGRRVYEEGMQEGTDPRGRAYYWIGAGGEMFDDIPDSDCVLIDQGYVTASVLRPSFLDESSNLLLRSKIAGVFDQKF